MKKFRHRLLKFEAAKSLSLFGEDIYKAPDHHVPSFY